MINPMKTDTTTPVRTSPVPAVAARSHARTRRPFAGNAAAVVKW